MCSSDLVNMSSLAARNGGGPGAVAYAASKGAIIAYTRGLAKEVAGKGITVNAVAPGLILETPFHETFNTDAGIQGAINATPLKRGGTPADVAGAVVYFVSELGAFITGEIIEINGGLHVACLFLVLTSKRRFELRKNHSFQINSRRG